jgi:chromatin segregation and condensation protein Rec8/ScpA/Scc1 (kleisin family)|tara:strand:- start:455 stop:826 length:372 start_codon:yes stop_codon:yes gene_type:complete
MENSEIKKAMTEAKKKLARELEEHLKYKEAIDIWEELKMYKEAKRIRSKVKEEGKIKVDQTVVHGDYVDDRDTIIKDSVVSRSNVSSGRSSRMQELKELKEMLSEGLIDKDDFKEMKKEIMGK